MSARSGRFFDRYNKSNETATDEDANQTTQPCLANNEDNQTVLGTGSLHSGYPHEMNTNEYWVQDHATASSINPFDTAHQAEGSCTSQTPEECDRHDLSQVSLDNHNTRRFSNFIQLDRPRGNQRESSNTQDSWYDMDQMPSYLHLLKRNPFDRRNREEDQLTWPSNTQALSLLESTGDVRAVDFEQLNREIRYQRG